MAEYGKFGDELTRISNAVIAERQQNAIEKARQEAEAKTAKLIADRARAARFVHTLEPLMLAAAQDGKKSIKAARIKESDKDYNDALLSTIRTTFGYSIKAQIEDEHDGMGMNSWKSLYLRWD